MASPRDLMHADPGTVALGFGWLVVVFFQGIIGFSNGKTGAKDTKDTQVRAYPGTIFCLA